MFNLIEYIDPQKLKSLKSKLRPLNLGQLHSNFTTTSWQRHRKGAARSCQFRRARTIHSKKKDVHTYRTVRYVSIARIFVGQKKSRQQHDGIARVVSRM